MLISFDVNVCIERYDMTNEAVCRADALLFSMIIKGIF